jgi:hypothetical protein
MERIVRELETYVLIIYEYSKGPGCAPGPLVVFSILFCQAVETICNTYKVRIAKWLLSLHCQVFCTQKVKLKWVFLNVSTSLLKTFGDFVIVARRSMHIQEITNIDASRRPAIGKKGLQSVKADARRLKSRATVCKVPLRGLVVWHKASFGVKVWLKESAVGRTLQYVAREFIHRASAGDYDAYFLFLHQPPGAELTAP